MKKFHAPIRQFSLLLLFVILGSQFQSANALELPSLKKDDDWQYRKDIRELWPTQSAGASEANLNALLSQNYPGSDVSWRDMVLATYVANQITEEARKAQRPTDEKLIDFALSTLAKQAKSYATGKVQDKLKLTLPPELSYSAMAITGFYNAMLTFAKTIKQTQLNMQLQKYFVARDAHISQQEIKNGTAEDIEFNHDPDGGWWITTVKDSNAINSGENSVPYDLQPNQVWEIGELLYQAKTNPGSFDTEKDKIGEQLQKLLQNQSVRVGYLIGKKLMIEGVEDSSLHPATEAEKKNWQQQTETMSAKSPDGKYQVDGRQRQDDWWHGFMFNDEFKAKIIRVEDGETVLDTAAMMSNFKFHDTDYGDFRQSACFDGWTPDSRHFVVVGEDGNAGGAMEIRCIINVESKKMIRFNGWASPDMKVALVPADEGKAFQGTISNKTGKNVSHLDFYAIRLPENLEDYKASTFSFTRKKLTINGKAFRMSLLKSVQFSSDDKWALCQSYKLEGTSPDPEWAGFFSSDPNSESNFSSFLVSIETGKVRDLRGRQARFLSSGN